MKIYSNRSCLTLVLLFCFALAANSQDVDKNQNTKERFSDQLKKGTVPGLKFAPVTTMLQPKKEDNSKEPENTIRDLKMGKGNNIKTSASAGANSVSSQTENSNSNLASDKKPELKLKDSTTIKRVIPSQDSMQENPQKKQ
jgi:hypothetical protein